VIQVYRRVTLHSEVVDIVTREVARRHMNHTEHNPSLLSDKMTDLQRLAALIETVGQVSADLEYVDGVHNDELIASLIQNASVSLSWAQYLMRRSGRLS